MFQKLFESSALLHLPVVVLVVFFAIFVGVVIWVTVSHRGKFDQMARLPLDESADGESNSADRDGAAMATTGGETR